MRRPAAAAAEQPGREPLAGVGTPAERLHWVIGTTPEGVMSWFIPATGELLRGKADGRPRPLIGPQQPAGRTFVWRRLGPGLLEFFASDNGKLIGRATEELSPDGLAFTDTLWYPATKTRKTCGCS